MKKIGLIILFLFVIFSIQAEEQVTRLGQHPFYKSRDLQPADLKIIAVERAGEVKQGFEQAGNGELVYAFLEQIQKAEIQTVELNPGDRVQWMLFKRGKRVEVKKDVVWAGKKPMTAYLFTIFYQTKLYEFIVPRICGNISLKSIKDVPPPSCAMSLNPREVEAGKPVTINTCQSANSIKTIVTISDQQENILKTIEFTPENCSGEYIPEKTGNYKVKAVAVNEYGMESANGCEAEFRVIEAPAAIPQSVPEKVEKVNPLHFMLEGGMGVLRGTYTGTLWARAGIVFNISEDKLDLIFALGGGLPVKGEPWKAYLMGHGLLNLHLKDAFIAGGLGFSTKEREARKSGIDFVGQIGYNLFKNNGSTGSLFGELRAPVFTSDRPFKEHHKFLFGFRYIF